MKVKKWDSTNITDQTGRVVIVTGSSSGIGYEAARVLANKNAEVIIAVRNSEKGRSAMNKITAQNSNANVKVMILDLADLESVKKFAGEFKQKYTRLDLLISNAGIMVPPYSKTKDGFELQIGTNHLGHFALTGLLLDLLNKTPNSRIVNVSSNAHKMGKINFNDLNWEKRKYSAWKAYGDSKIANLYFTYELQKRLNGNGSNTKVAASHPGWTATNLQRHSGLAGFMNPFLAQGIDMGALPTLYAAVVNDVNSGDYYGPSGWQEWKGYPKKTDSNSLSKDPKIAEKLWTVSEELTGVKFEF